VRSRNTSKFGVDLLIAGGLSRTSSLSTKNCITGRGHLAGVLSYRRRDTPENHSKASKSQTLYLDRFASPGSSPCRNTLCSLGGGLFAVMEAS